MPGHKGHHFKERKLTKKESGIARNIIEKHYYKYELGASQFNDIKKKNLIIEHVNKRLRRCDGKKVFTSHKLEDWISNKIYRENKKINISPVEIIKKENDRKEQRDRILIEKKDMREMKRRIKIKERETRELIQMEKREKRELIQMEKREKRELIQMEKREMREKRELIQIEKQVMIDTKNRIQREKRDVKNRILSERDEIIQKNKIEKDKIEKDKFEKDKFEKDKIEKEIYGLLPDTNFFIEQTLPSIQINEFDNELKIPDILYNKYFEDNISIIDVSFAQYFKEIYQYPII